MALPVIINEVKGCLIVDSGAQCTSLDSSAAKSLRVDLKPTGRIATGIAGTERIMAGRISAIVPGCRADDFPTLSGYHDFLDVPVRLFPGIGKNFGVIGLSELVSAGAVIDCGGASMPLDPDEHYAAPAGWQGISMAKFAKPGHHEFLWAVQAGIGKSPCRMVVDTAATSTVITENFARRAGIPLKKTGNTMHGAGSHAGREETVAVFPLLVGKTVDLGITEANGIDMPVLDVQCDNLPVAGILGLAQLRRMKAIIDCRRGVLYATAGPLKAPAEPCADAALASRAIIALAQSGDEEAKRVLSDSRQNHRPIALSPQEVGEFVARAKEKGLIK